MLELRQSGLRYGEDWVFRELDLVLPPKGIVLVRGPNGAGKSSFLDVVSGFLPLTEGSVHEVDGDVLRPRFLRRRVGRLHQTDLLPALPVAELLRSVTARPRPFWADSVFGPRPVAETHAGNEVLLAAGVDPSSRDCTKRLSGGQRRALAGVTMLRLPKPIIALDEPFSGLTSSVRVRFAALLKTASSNRLIVIGHPAGSSTLLTSIAVFELWLDPSSTRR